MFFFIRLILSLRYFVRLKAPAALEKKRSGGFLFLPNHVALIDPVLIFAWLWPRFRMRPVVVEFIHRNPVFRTLLNKFGAFVLPDFETSVNQYKTRKAERTLKEVAEALKRGENILFYPSGKLKKGGLESLQGNGGLHKLLELCPEANIVLVRTTGLWGSSFSKALTGASPHPAKTIVQGLKKLWLNALFFMPRRQVEIEVAEEPSDFPRGVSRVELNLYLENWYNRGGPEPLALVRSYFWSSKLPQVYVPPIDAAPVSTVSNATRAKLYAEIRQILDRPDLNISPDMRFSTDLGMDSLNLAEFIAYVGQNYPVGPLHPDQFDKVQDALALIEGSKKGQQIQSSLTWPEEKRRPACFMRPGKTYQEVFFNVCKDLGPFIACADDRAGLFTYNKLFQSVLVLAQHFRQFPEERVAVALPASVGVYIVYFALLFAGKVPVMLNWTLGPRYLEEMMRISQARRILTSWHFLEKVSDVDFGTTADQIELLEDIRPKLTLGQKIKGLLLARSSLSIISRSLRVDYSDENRTIVLLFTSGTEAVPKAVPLTSRNVISNLRNSIERMQFLPHEIFYGILPPFHSFGFSANGTLPLFLGTRIAFFPDPTDSYQIAEGIERWRVTGLVMPPTFLKRLLQVADPKIFKNIHVIVTGAEKTSSELIEHWRKVNQAGEIIEGYGATECSPTISLGVAGEMSRLGRLPDGVGRVILTNEVRTIHPETQEPLPEGAEGEICVSGPSVFGGYLGDVASPFIEIDGKSWYRTGDIGRVGPDRVVFLTDRLKRFAKIGAEMISLHAIEKVLIEELTKLGKIPLDAASIAVISDEKSDKQQLILFTTVPLQLEELNAILLAKGFSRLVKLSKINTIQELPILATGKTNYRKLKEFHS